MRKFVMAIGLLILILGILGINTGFGVNADPNSVAVGSIDLSTFDYSTMPGIVLEGEWGFYPDELVDPDYLESVEVDRTDAKYITVPSSWKGYGTEGQDPGLPSFGFATYHLRIQVPKAGYYGLAIDTIYTAYELYINGELIGGSGVVGETPEIHKAQFFDRTLIFKTDTEQVDIVFHISNFTHPRGGIGKAPIITNPDRITKLMLLSHGISLFICGALLMTSLFLLFFFEKQNRDLGIVYFALFCIIIAIRTISTNTVIGSIFPSIGTEFQVKLEYLSITLGFITFILYTRHAFRGVLNKKLTVGFNLIAGAYSLLIVLTPMNVYNRALLPFNLLIAVFALYWSVAMFILWFRKEQSSGIILFGGIVMATAIMIDMFFYTSGETNLFAAEISSFGLIFFIITHVSEFSFKFLEALHLSQDLTDRLELRIEDRTRQLNELNKKLLLMATKDELTDLWNRNELQRRSEEEASRYNRYYTTTSPHFAILYVDLDNFKYINDNYSHEAGDLVLKQFSMILSRYCRKSDAVFRMGGDEFVMFLPKTDAEGAARTADRILSSFPELMEQIQKDISNLLERTVTIDAEHALSCSIGIAVHSQGYINVERLIQYADTALLQAKEKGKNRYVIFEDINGSSISEPLPIT